MKAYGTMLDSGVPGQFFGHVQVDGRTRQMTVTLCDVTDQALWSTTIDPVDNL